MVVNSVFLSLHVFVLFPVSSLELISSFISFCLGKMLAVIFVLLNLLRIGVCPSVLSILENVLCALGKNVYPMLLEVMSIRPTVLFKEGLCLLSGFLPK